MHKENDDDAKRSMFKQYMKARKAEGYKFLTKLDITYPYSAGGAGARLQTI